MDDSLSAAEGESGNDVVVGYRLTTSYCAPLHPPANSASSTSHGQSYNGLIAYFGCILLGTLVLIVLRFIFA
jgi:hypothetical protein